MLQPKKVKYRRVHRDRSALHGQTKGGWTMSFGQFGLKAITPKEITSRQIEAARKSIMNYLQRQGKLWIRTFPQKGVTRKAAEVPMGSGKGSPDHFVDPVRPGKILFELAGVTEEQARGAFERASAKLPLQTKFVINEY